MQNQMRLSLSKLKRTWRGSSAAQESTFHQLAPYIGKLKTTIARALIERYSVAGQTVLDPFAGSGVVPLESILLRRNIVANDLNPYAATLTRAKMFAPLAMHDACEAAEDYVTRAKRMAAKHSYCTEAPPWVKEFFHRKTLAEVECLAQLLRMEKQPFLLACLLGILHHQRPGFLSFPSSHLVPYLRSRRFPRGEFPEMYRYRDVRPRLIAKILRAYRRDPPLVRSEPRVFTEKDIAYLEVNHPVDLVLTSPPYMNALDYGRDNRLRLWLLGYNNYKALDSLNCGTAEEFAVLIRHLVRVSDRCLTHRGKVVVVVGEISAASAHIDTSSIVTSVFKSSGKFQLLDKITDFIPQVRRSRRGSRTTKREWILTFSRMAKQ